MSKSKLIAKKTFNFGKHAIASNRKINLVTLTIELSEDEQGRPVFTAQGDAWNNLHTDIVCGGQCIDTMMEQCRELRLYKTYKTIHDLWKKHHLNDTHAGTEAQESALHAWWEKEGECYDYNKECEYLESVGLLYDNGYKYGTGWLYRPIPDEDLAKIKGLLGIK